jgi:hypothetical protein
MREHLMGANDLKNQACAWLQRRGNDMLKKSSIMIIGFLILALIAPVQVAPARTIDAQPARMIFPSPAG